jgi:hypothetical protein
VEGVTGRLFATFSENGSSSAGFENFQVWQSIDGEGLNGRVSTTDMYLTFNGVSTGRYTASGGSLIGSGPGGAITVKVDTYVEDVFISSTDIPFRPEDFPGGSATPTRYTCSGDTLTMWPPVPGITVSPVVYQRQAP